MSDGQEVLVTGRAGFVGATLVRRLVADGYRVHVLDNRSTGDPAHLNGMENPGSGFADEIFRD
jgi:nucleoside-diphosphate-sugar epimerase